MAKVSYKVKDVKALEKQYTEVLEKLAEYNSAIDADKHTAIKNTEKECRKAVKAYNFECRKAYYSKLVSEKQALRIVLTTAYVGQIKMVLSTDEKHFEIAQDVPTLIPILEFEDFYMAQTQGLSSGVYSAWSWEFETLAYRVADATAVRFNTTDKRFDEFYDLVSAGKMGAVDRVGNVIVDDYDANDFIESNKALWETLQELVNDMIAGVELDAIDARYVAQFMVGLEKSSGRIVIPTRKTMAELVTLMLYRKLNNMGYEIKADEKQSGFG